MAKARPSRKAARKGGRKPAKPVRRAAKRRGGTGPSVPKRGAAKSRRVAKPVSVAHPAAQAAKTGVRPVRAGAGRSRRVGGTEHAVVIIPEMQPPPLPAPIASFTF